MSGSFCAAANRWKEPLDRIKEANTQPLVATNGDDSTAVVGETDLSSTAPGTRGERLKYSANLLKILEQEGQNTV